MTKPVLGQTVEPDDLKNSITENWLDPAGVEVEPVEVEPAINDDAIEAMRTGDVAKALDNPLTINGENNVAGTLRKDEIAQFVSIEAKDGKLELKVDTPKAQQLSKSAWTVPRCRVRTPRLPSTAAAWWSLLLSTVPSSTGRRH